MFEITRQPLITEIRCSQCTASMTIESDNQTLINRSIKIYERCHTCRSSLLRKDAQCTNQHNQKKTRIFSMTNPMS